MGTSISLTGMALLSIAFHPLNPQGIEVATQLHGNRSSLSSVPGELQVQESRLLFAEDYTPPDRGGPDQSQGSGSRT